MRIVAALVMLLSLGGCLAQAAIDVVTLPVKVVSAGVDAATTSQSEADEKRGREIRKQEEREGREARRLEKERKREGGNESYEDGQQPQTN
jgi:hypothetical protein